MRNYRKIGAAIVAVITWMTSLLPIMSSRLNDGESCTLIVKGYNLMEFSAWGCVPVVAPLLVLMVLFGSQTRAVKEIALLIILAANMVCYVHACNAARAWLEAECGSLITYYPGILLSPLGAVGAFLLAFFACQDRVHHRGNDFWDFRESAKQQGSGG